MSTKFTKLLVRGCDECPLRSSIAELAACSIAERELTGDLTQAPTWCPARGAITIQLNELPGDFHRWGKRGDVSVKAQFSRGEISACIRCDLKRKASKSWFMRDGKRQATWVWMYLVADAWTQDRPGCSPKKDAS